MSQIIPITIANNKAILWVLKIMIINCPKNLNIVEAMVEFNNSRLSSYKLNKAINLKISEWEIIRKLTNTNNQAKSNKSTDQNQYSIH